MRCILVYIRVSMIMYVIYTTIVFAIQILSSEEAIGYISCSDDEVLCIFPGSIPGCATLCNNVTECLNGMDEGGICKQCEAGQTNCYIQHDGYGCADTCDGISDCYYGEDESPEQCKNCTMPGLTFCIDMSVCIPEESLCDGMKNCNDFSDEIPRRCNNCQDSILWPCADNQTCINQKSLCNGHQECLDNSDE